MDQLQGLSDSMTQRSQQNTAENMIKREEIQEQNEAVKTFQQQLQAAAQV